MKIRNLALIVLGIIFLQIQVNAQQNFDYEISGKIPGADKIILSFDRYGSKLLDSTSNVSGEFVFKGKANAISLGTLIVENKNKLFSEYYPVFIEPGKTHVALYNEGFQMSASGTHNNDIMSKVEKGMQDFYKAVTPLYDSLNYASMKIAEINRAEIVDKKELAKMQDMYKRYGEEAAAYQPARSAKLRQAYQEYPNTYFTAYYALYSGGIEDKGEYEKLYAHFNEELKNSAIGQEWKEAVTGENSLPVGSMAPDFTAVDLNGRKISLNDYRGKYVLLDFWATWCGPCRMGNPHLIELYNKYKSSDIEFIGIADDDKNVGGWKKAIENDGIGIWPQVLRGRVPQEGQEEGADLSTLYKVHGYPTKILLDKEGKIVAQFLGDDDLDKLLVDIFRK